MEMGTEKFFFSCASSPRPLPQLSLQEGQGVWAWWQQRAPVCVPGSPDVPCPSRRVWACEFLLKWSWDTFLSFLTLKGYKWGLAMMPSTTETFFWEKNLIQQVPVNKSQRKQPDLFQTCPKFFEEYQSCHALLFTLTSLYLTGLWHRQQDLWLLLSLLCHQMCSGGHQEGPQAAPGLHWTLQM